jgi:hypothetical protein
MQIMRTTINRASFYLEETETNCQIAQTIVEFTADTESRHGDYASVTVYLNPKPAKPEPKRII